LSRVCALPHTCAEDFSYLHAQKQEN
jgi:hypothetical protein